LYFLPSQARFADGASLPTPSPGSDAAPAAPLTPQPSRGEGALWVDQWVNAAKQLNQWDALQVGAL
jgi:hypothetical protein